MWVKQLLLNSFNLCDYFSRLQLAYQPDMHLENLSPLRRLYWILIGLAVTIHLVLDVILFHLNQSLYVLVLKANILKSSDHVKMFLLQNYLAHPHCLVSIKFHKSFSLIQNFLPKNPELVGFSCVLIRVLESVPQEFMLLDYPSVSILKLATQHRILIMFVVIRLFFLLKQ